MAKVKPTSTKKLVRIVEGKVVAGVCSGLGSYFAIDPTIIRLIFIFITIFGGSGILLYLVLWLIIPAENSSGELNEDNIRENAKEIKDKAKEFGKNAKVFADSQNSRYIFGVGLLVLGVTLTLSNFGFFHYFNFARLWPLALIILAFAILKENGK